MIKFEHSVFALPFALTGALLAARFTSHGWPSWRQILWIVVAMVSARSAAMTINRIADLRYDKENPRTKMRALATGTVSMGFAWVFTFVAVALFVIAAWQLNPLALKLSPVALAILFFYSFTKRFTNFSHLFLGFALGVSRTERMRRGPVARCRVNEALAEPFLQHRQPTAQLVRKDIQMLDPIEMR